MCDKQHYDDLCVKIEHAESKFDTGFQIMGKEMGRIASHAFDAKMSGERNTAIVEAIKDTLAVYHTEDRADRKELWEEIDKLKSFKYTLLGVATGVSFGVSALFVIVQKLAG